MISLLRCKVPIELNHLHAPPQTFVLTSEGRLVVRGEHHQEVRVEREELLVQEPSRDRITTRQALEQGLSHRLVGFTLSGHDQPSPTQRSDVVRDAAIRLHLKRAERRVRGDLLEHMRQRGGEHRLAIRTRAPEDAERLLVCAARDSVADQPLQVVRHLLITRHNLLNELHPTLSASIGVVVHVDPTGQKQVLVILNQSAPPQVDYTVGNREQVIMRVELADVRSHSP